MFLLSSQPETFNSMFFTQAWYVYGFSIVAIIGGLFGNKLGNNNQQITGYRTVKKCSTSYDTSSEQYLAGYKITYQAAGFTGTTTRTRNPGVGGNISVVIRMTAQ